MLNFNSMYISYSEAAFEGITDKTCGCGCGSNYCFSEVGGHDGMGGGGAHWIDMSTPLAILRF